MAAILKRFKYQHFVGFSEIYFVYQSTHTFEESIFNITQAIKTFVNIIYIPLDGNLGILGIR